MASRLSGTLSFCSTKVLTENAAMCCSHVRESITCVFADHTQDTMDFNGRLHGNISFCCHTEELRTHFMLEIVDLAVVKTKNGACPCRRSCLPQTECRFTSYTAACLHQINKAFSHWSSCSVCKCSLVGCCCLCYLFVLFHVLREEQAHTFIIFPHHKLFVNTLPLPYLTWLFIIAHPDTHTHKLL